MIKRRYGQDITLETRAEAHKTVYFGDIDALKPFGITFPFLKKSMSTTDIWTIRGSLKHAGPTITKLLKDKLK